MQNKLIKALSIIDALLLLAVLVGNVIDLLQESTTSILASVISLACTIFAIYYILTGAKKGEGSKLYQLFLAAFSFCQLISLVDHAAMSTADVLFIALSFGALCILAVAKDLGETKSVLLALLVLVCAALRFVSGAVVGIVSNVWLNVTTILLLSLTVLLFVFAKYTDKAARGSK